MSTSELLDILEQKMKNLLEATEFYYEKKSESGYIKDDFLRGFLYGKLQVRRQMVEIIQEMKEEHNVRTE